MRNTSFIKTSFNLLILLCLFIFNQSCQNNPGAPSNAALIEGKVVETENQRALEGVLVRSAFFADEAITDENGKYSLEVPLPDSSSINVSLVFTKEGYVEYTISDITIKNGQLKNVPNAILTKGQGPTESSGDASNIVLIDVETSSISIKGSGGNENSDITFEVRDNKGIPVDLDHQVRVFFRIEGGTGGGEFVSPDTALTDFSGKVTTTMNSGTVAGALQVRAGIVGLAVTSTPVPISIHSGLPDLEHFSIAAQTLNFAGYKFFNLQNLITALVGDKFSNPVQAGTSVYFHSTGGLIDGSAITDDSGIATGILRSGGPRPQGIIFTTLRRIQPANLPTYFAEPGYALITAQTVDENQQKIYAEGVVLFSGETQISAVNPNTFSLNAGQSQTFSFTVCDHNNNPLTPGTTIGVSTNKGDVVGDVSINLSSRHNMTPILIHVH